MLAAAQTGLFDFAPGPPGRPAERLARRGRAGREIVAACTRRRSYVPESFAWALAADRTVLCHYPVAEDAYSCAMSNEQRDSTREAASGGVQSVDRALSVLEILARRGEAGVSELAAEIGVHKSTASRLLGALEERELVDRARDRGKYRLGFGILRLAGAIPAQLDITRQARPVFEELAARLGETVNLAVRQSHFAVNLDQARGPSAVGTYNWVGQLTPLHATSSGKVLLAYLPDRQRRELLEAAELSRFTECTVTSVRELEAELAAVRTDGYAVSVEEYEAGLNAIAAPVRDHTGQTIAAMSVSGPAYRFTERGMHAAAPDVITAASEISLRMGSLL
jgi:DNA-binding IclR family transcriptional regulator